MELLTLSHDIGTTYTTYPVTIRNTELEPQLDTKEL